uniref:Uncharacterized protein n=1 Tax=Anopheles melas TaxID=34690 RepID=A0A182U3N6_9DIPT
METINRRQCQPKEELIESSTSSRMTSLEVGGGEHHQGAFIEQLDHRKIAPRRRYSLPANTPKAIETISAPSTNDGGDVAVAAVGGASSDAVQPSDATIRTSHNDYDDDDDEKPTHIDTVTLKCDLNDYLIKLIDVSCSLARSDGRAGLPPRNAVPSSQGSKMVARDNISLKSSGRRTHGGPTYTHFDELVRCTEREREWLRRGLSHRLPRLRLCGGGEDSINNGT